MANYIIIGGDQKEYGPISAADIRQWIAESRLNEQSLVKGEGDAEFRALGKFPEFADLFAFKNPSADEPPSIAGASGSSAPECEYELDMGGCISRGWSLVKDNMGVLFVGTLVYFLIQMAIGGLSSIPIIGPLISIANFIISGPLMAGVFYMFIRAIRNESAEIGDIFSGFRRGFGQLFLGMFVPALIIGACLLPFIIVLLIKIIPLFGQLQHLQNGQSPDPETLAALKSVLVVCLPVLLVCLVPVMYLSVCWRFTLPIIIDKGLDFWTAMKTSRRQVRKHWWHVFGLLILIGLLNVVGVLLCCIGMLFTFPVGLAALMFAYETIFPDRPSA